MRRSSNGPPRPTAAAPPSCTSSAGSNATTLYGHLEAPRHRIDHLCRLRALQDETGGFQTFIPLAFHPENTRLAHLAKASGLMDLRTLALSRLMLDNFPHVKAYWVML